MSRSPATSLMVRNASGALSKCPLPFPIPLSRFPWLKRGYRVRKIVFANLGVISSEQRRRFPDRALFGVFFFDSGCIDVIAVDPLLQDRRRLEHHHAPRRDRNFGSRLRIASDALTFLAHHERAERGELHRFAFLKA